MDMTALAGWLATGASTISFAPQAWKIIRTRETQDISTGMYALTVSGFALWTVYGSMLGAWPLVVTNAVCLSLSGFILLMILLPRSKRESIAGALDPTRPASPGRGQETPPPDDSA